jgi:PAS domain S-box-containing protein
MERQTKDAAQALRESEARLKGIIASATDAIITVDERHRIILFNAAAERLFQCSAVTALGQPLDRFIPERFRARHSSYIRAFSETGVSTRTMGAERVLAALRADGTEFPMEAQISQVTVGGQKLYTVIIRDITMRKRAEDALRDSEQRLAVELAAVTRMQQVSTRLVHAGDFSTLLNEILDAAIELTGANMGNIQLLDGGVLKIAAQRGFEEPFLNFFNTVHEGQAACGAAMRSGARVVVEDVAKSPVFAGRALEVMLAARALAVQSTPLISRTGRMLGMFSTHYHAPYRPSERELRLLDVLARQAADLIERMQADLALRDNDRRKDEFLAMLSHELRNPLAAVRNAVAIASLDETHRAHALEIARRQVEQLGRLIDDLLDVARITQGRITLRKERLYLASIIERAIESTRSFIESRGLYLTVSLGPEPIRVEADPARLEQVFVNLLTNAAKYTDAGGRINLVATRRGDEAVVRICDTGIGIAPETLPHLWDLFTQGDQALNRPQGGLGIGLTIARRLIEQHGARIEAFSEGLGKGAEFVVSFPALPPLSEEAVPAPPSAPIPQCSTRIIIVEDNPDAADSLMMLLELLGHRVRVVHDGVAALNAARANLPDVMLVDIGLPGMDGHEVARRMRRDPALKDIVLVALTGYGREEDKQQALAAGFDYHLVKPVDPDALHGLVARLGKDEPKTPQTLH